MTAIAIDGREVDEVADWVLDPAGPDVTTDGEGRWLQGRDLEEALAGGWRRVARDLASGEWLVWRPVPARPAAPTARVEVGGRPDAHRLWQVWQRVAMAQLDQLGLLRWRVCRGDLEALAEDAGVQVSVPPSGHPASSVTLFGLPVDVVEDAAGRWPELVLVVDRRV